MPLDISEEQQRQILDQRMAYNESMKWQQNIKPYQPPDIPKFDPPKIQPPNIVLPQRPGRYQMDDSTAGFEKTNKIIYFKALIKEYGWPNDVCKLNASQKETLKEEVINVKLRVNDWKEFDSKEIATINLICDQYLSKLPR